jgi:hypothetical protein
MVSNLETTQLGISRGRGIRKSRARNGLNANAVVVSACLMTVFFGGSLWRMQSTLLTDADMGTSTTSTTSTQSNLHYIAVKDDPRYSISEEQLSDFDFYDLHKHLDCSLHARNQSKPLYTPQMYQIMREKYTELTGYAFPILSYEQDVFHIAKIDGAGRGVFASRNITEGEIIPFEASCTVVSFDSGMLWKKYAVSLPREMACDVHEWTWTQDVYHEGNTKLLLSIGDGDSYLNNPDPDEDETIVPTNLTSMKFQAARNIQKGEELMYDYDVFEPTKYDMFGLDND